MGTFALTQIQAGKSLWLYPNGDLSTCTPFTAAGASPNYACVDENRLVPDEDATYVYWNNVAVGYDLYNLQNPSLDFLLTAGAINYVQVYARAKSHETPQHIDGVYKIICSPDSTCSHTYKSEDINLTTGYTTYTKVWVNNPNTAIAWTWENIYALNVGVECSSPGINPEIRTTQCYVKINYDTEIECRLNSPEYIGRSHDRNIKMLNFWNGSREVYDLNRSGKSMLLIGAEFETGEIELEEVTFYFNDYDPLNAFAFDPEHLVDGNISTFANGNLTGDNQTNIENTSTAPITSTGAITKVEIRIRLDNCWNCSPPGAVETIRLRPIFNGVDDGDNHDWVVPDLEIACNSDWFDITNDTNAPVNWNWVDAGSLDMYIEYLATCTGTPAAGISIIELRITYEATKRPCDRIICVRNMARNGSTIAISGFALEYYNGDYKINSFGWNKVSEKPEHYKWILQLESVN